MADEKIVRTDNLAHYKELQEQNVQKLIDSLKQELKANDDKVKQDIMTILEQIKVKASDTEPENAEDMTVWFDVTNKLVKVRVDGEWISMGAVYQ